jgi:hypothetical protein
VTSRFVATYDGISLVGTVTERSGHGGKCSTPISVMTSMHQPGD